MSEDVKPANLATAKDALFFQVILCSMKNKPDVDWAVVAAKSGYKDGKTASTRYGQIMKKLTGVSAGKAMAGATAGSPITSPIKASPKKNGVAGAGPGAGRGVKKEKEAPNGVIGAKIVKPRKNPLNPEAGNFSVHGGAASSYDDETEGDESYRKWVPDTENFREYQQDLKRETFPEPEVAFDA